MLPLDTAGITSGLGAILTIVVLFIAIRSMFHAMRGSLAAVLTAIVIVAASAMLWGLAASGELATLGTDLVHLIFKL